eukprot:g31375.t1
MGVSGFEIDVGAEMVTGNGDREVQEGEGGVGDGPGEFEVRVKAVSKVDELFKLLMGARGSADTVINVVEEKGRNGASVTAEEELLHVSYEETSIAQTHASARSHPFSLGQSVMVEGCLLSWRPITSGVPQRLVLRPLLFVIYVNNLDENIEGIV